MRKKVTALMMAAAMACGSLIACGADSTTAYASETIYGEVTAVSDDGFTITVGTYADNELTLGDETAEITVSDNTVYKMAAMGGGKQDGQAPEGGAPEGEAPEGEAPADMQQGGQGQKPAEGDMEVSLSSISAGTQVAVTFDPDGNVESVEILK